VDSEEDAFDAWFRSDVEADDWYGMTQAEESDYINNEHNEVEAVEEEVSNWYLDLEFQQQFSLSDCRRLVKAVFQIISPYTNGATFEVLV
jgi:hypothetical protein